MDWVSLIGSIGSAASGGVLGLVGAGFSAFMKQRQQKVDNKHELALMDQQAKVAKTEGSYNGLVESIKAQATLKTHMWVNDIRSLFRPGLTTALLIVSYSFFWQFLDALGNQDANLAKFFTDGEIVEVLRYIINSLVFSTSTAIAWWFGDRAMNPPQWRN